MIRLPALIALASTMPVLAAPLPRGFTVTSFDRIRMEAPYAVTVTTGRAPFARAEGTPAALDAVDLRVEGRTLIIRKRSGELGTGPTGPVRIALGTPDLLAASNAGSGSLTIDRLRGLSVTVAMLGSGSLDVREVAADRIGAAVQGSGSLTLKGQAKSATLTARGTPVLSAGELQSDEATIATEGTGEVSAAVRKRATVTAEGTVKVTLLGRPACLLKVSGSASVEGCASR
jgi:hypothetical protein